MLSTGYGGPLKDVPAEKFNCTAMPKSYQSPWEQALISDPSLAETLVARMPEPETRHEIPQYKSFNRSVLCSKLVRNLNNHTKCFLCKKKGTNHK